MKTSKIVLVFGCALFATSPFVAAELSANEAITLSARQMDALTAGTVTIGNFPLAIVQATATAVGTYAHTATSVHSAVRKTESDNLPSVADTYGTFTSGSAIAVGVSGASDSLITEVSTTNEQPFANVLGGTINGTITGINAQITHTSTAYYGGAWVTYYLNKMNP